MFALRGSIFYKTGVIDNRNFYIAATENLSVFCEVENTPCFSIDLPDPVLRRSMFV